MLLKNYRKQQMLRRNEYVALQLKNKIGFIEGRVVRKENESKKFKTYKRLRELVKTITFTSRLQ